MTLKSLYRHADNVHMDILTVIGTILALIALVGGSVLKGAGLGALWNGAAFVIVIIGTFAAIFLHVPLAAFKHGLKISVWTLKPPANDRRTLLEQILEWSQTSRKQGLLGLESFVEQQTDPFVKKGMQMLVDGVEPDTIRNMLEIQASSEEAKDMEGAKVFESMGVYAPTLGIIGAVLGLMAVMKNLADPANLGYGIAAAFTATIYGIASANLLFLPMAAKLKGIIAKRSTRYEMVIEGFMAIACGENPRNIESRLSGFMD